MTNMFMIFWYLEILLLIIMLFLLVYTIKFTSNKIKSAELTTFKDKLPFYIICGFGLLIELYFIINLASVIIAGANI